MLRPILNLACGSLPAASDEISGAGSPLNARPSANVPLVLWRGVDTLALAPLLMTCLRPRRTSPVVRSCRQCSWLRCPWPSGLLWGEIFLTRGRREPCRARAIRNSGHSSPWLSAILFGRTTGAARHPPCLRYVAGSANRQADGRSSYSSCFSTITSPLQVLDAASYGRLARPA
jgi:hypothetical protein